MVELVEFLDIHTRKPGCFSPGCLWNQKDKDFNLKISIETLEIQSTNPPLYLIFNFKIVVCRVPQIPFKYIINTHSRLISYSSRSPHSSTPPFQHPSPTSHSNSNPTYFFTTYLLINQQLKNNLNLMFSDQ